MSQTDEKHTTAERITLIISLLILAAVLGLAGYSNITIGEEPPTITAEADLENVRETDGGFYVPITITNNGGLTAQDVTVSGELDLGDGEPEMAEITIAFLAGGESEQAEMMFSVHPNEGELTVRPTSYLVP